MPFSPEEVEILFHHRWSVPAIAELHRLSGTRFVVLSNRLGVGAPALRQALDFLIENGLAMRNPGHGHPLRPEYILTKGGEDIAPHCLAFMGSLDGDAVRRVALMKWTVAVLLAIGGGALRYSEIRSRLPKLTGRALAAALKQMAAAGLIERRVIDGYPPTTTYTATELGQRLVA